MKRSSERQEDLTILPVNDAVFDRDPKERLTAGLVNGLDYAIINAFPEQDRDMFDEIP
jgi:hypothetical protein